MSDPVSHPKEEPALLPCPFCGEVPTEESIIDDNEGIAYTPSYRVFCFGCSMSIASQREMKDAIARWNRRASLASASEDTAREALVAARVVETGSDAEKALRREWWLSHGCPFGALYGDDGEMQCNACRVDFKRSSPNDIASRLKNARMLEDTTRGAPDAPLPPWMDDEGDVLFGLQQLADWHANVASDEETYIWRPYPKQHYRAADVLRAAIARLKAPPRDALSANDIPDLIQATKIAIGRARRTVVKDRLRQLCRKLERIAAPDNRASAPSDPVAAPQRDPSTETTE